MSKTNHTESSPIFRQAVLIALMEQEKVDPAPLRALLLRLLETPQTTYENIGWLLPIEPSFNTFHKSLIKYDMTSSDIELFKDHITGNEKPKAKIIWLANLNELVYLFDRLQDEEVIPAHRNQHVFLQERFLDKYGKSLKAGGLRGLLNKSVNNSERMEIINKIMNVVLSYKNT